MILSSVGLLSTNRNPTSAEIIQSLQGNICRCGTYPRIIEAVHLAAKSMQERGQ
jgi:aerobic-type carbon monoxide dehydrogenase small subunit (CoxS/CutS family)